MELSVVDQSPVPSGATAADALANTLDLARRCDEWGYRRYWLAEHHATEMLAGPAPEVLLARLGAETTGMRIGSGGVLLPHYSPFKVAEAFSVLEALYPGRVDLGIGRAPGGMPLVTLALQRVRTEAASADDFADQLVELLAWLDGKIPSSHPFSRIGLSPANPGHPEIWLLGSSPWSAVAAAQLGLPYCFAHFISPEPARTCLRTYRQRFDPDAGGLPEPRAMLAVGAVAADDRAEAERLYTTVRAIRHRITHNRRGPVPSPEEAIEELGQAPRGPKVIPGEWPRYLCGTFDRVVDQLGTMAGEVGVEEVLVVTITHDHDARCRSYEGLAKAAGLTPRPVSRRSAWSRP